VWVAAMQYAQMPAVRPKRSLVTTFFVAVLGLFCVVCVLQSDGITAEWGPLQVGYALAARPFSTVAARSSTPEMVDRTKKIPNKNVWTAFVKSSEVPPGAVVSGFRFGQEIAIANSGGTLYAISNKLPPTGQRHLRRGRGGGHHQGTHHGAEVQLEDREGCGRSFRTYREGHRLHRWVGR